MQSSSSDRPFKSALIGASPITDAISIANGKMQIAELTIRACRVDRCDCDRSQFVRFLEERSSFLASDLLALDQEFDPKCGFVRLFKNGGELRDKIGLRFCGRRRGSLRRPTSLIAEADVQVSGTFRPWAGFPRTPQFEGQSAWFSHEYLVGSSGKFAFCILNFAMKTFAKLN